MVNRWTVGGVGVVLFGALLAWWFSGGAPRPDVPGPGVVEDVPRVGSVVSRTASVPGCTAKVEALRAALDAQRPLGGLDARVKITSGQVARLAGHVYPADGLDGEGAVRAHLATVPGVSIVSMDCAELPCMVRASMPKKVGESREAFTALVVGATEQRLGFRSVPKDVEGGVELAFALLPAGVPSSPERFARLRYRAAAAMSDDPSRFGQPTLIIGGVERPHPCGEDATALSREIAEYTHRSDNLNEKLAHWTWIVETLEGAPPDWPEGMDPAVHQAAAERIAERLDLEVLAFECDETPCLAQLSGVVDSSVTNEVALRQLSRAVQDERYAPGVTSVAVAEFDGVTRMFMVVALGPDLPVDSTRVHTRARGFAAGASDHVSRFAWDDPL